MSRGASPIEDHWAVGLVSLQRRNEGGCVVGAAILARRVEDETERHEIYKLRYRVYVEEMHRPQKYANHLEKFIEEPYDKDGVVLGVFEAGRAIATIRYNWLLAPCMRDYVDLYGLSHLSDDDLKSSVVVTKLMCERSFRKGPVLTNILVAVFEVGLKSGVRTAYMDTNFPLVPLFEKFGWVWDGKRVLVHPEYGEVALMRLDLLDEARLRSINSPFLAALDSRPKARPEKVGVVRTSQ